MKILQVGAPKSGNFWIYSIIQEIIKYSGIENKSFIKNQPVYYQAKNWDLSHDKQAGIDMLDIELEKYFYRISSAFREEIKDIDYYLENCTHVWTHSEFSPLTPRVLPKFDKIIYITRDPRDRAISASKYAFTPYMQKFYPHREKDPASYLEKYYPGIIRYWKNHVLGYIENKDQFGIYFVFYENFLYFFEQELEQLLDYLGIYLPVEQKLKIQENTRFNKMKKENPGHVRKGKFGEWKDKLNNQQKDITIEIAEPLLKLLNYPLLEDEFSKPMLKEGAIQ